jgi:hypothetical protein
MVSHNTQVNTSILRATHDVLIILGRGIINREQLKTIRRG